MYSGATALALVVLIASFDSGLCLNCYQCASTNSEDCKDPFNNKSDTIPIINCDSIYVDAFYRNLFGPILRTPRTANVPKYCLKMVIGSRFGDMVIRTCTEGPSDKNNTCSEHPENAFAPLAQATLKHCSVCKDDKCNGAAATAASLSLAAGAAVLAYLARY